MDTDGEEMKARETRAGECVRGRDDGATEEERNRTAVAVNACTYVRYRMNRSLARSDGEIT